MHNSYRMPYLYRYFFLFDSEVDLLAKGSTNLYKHDSLWCKKEVEMTRPCDRLCMHILLIIKFSFVKIIHNILISYMMRVYEI